MFLLVRMIVQGIWRCEMYTSSMLVVMMMRVEKPRQVEKQYQRQTRFFIHQKNNINAKHSQMSILQPIQIFQELSLF